MAAQVFAYIEHKDGVDDDTALELISAAQKIDPGWFGNRNRYRVRCWSGYGLQSTGCLLCGGVEV